MAAAIVSITLSLSSPTLQLSGSDEDDPFYLITTATIKSSSNPSSPITLHTGRFPVAVTALATVPPGGRTDLASPALQGHAIKDLVERGGGKKVEWDRVRTQWVPPRNLREDKYFSWATVPAKGELVVRHFLPREKLRESGVCAGEVYTTALDAQVSSACPVGFCSYGLLIPNFLTSDSCGGHGVTWRRT